MSEQSKLKPKDTYLFVYFAEESKGFYVRLYLDLLLCNNAALKHHQTLTLKMGDVSKP